jgi:TPR repeat protein
MFILGATYYLGEGDDIPVDKAKAVEWFAEAARKDHPAAAFNLAMCYEYGDGAAVDHAKARKLLKKAADLGLREVKDLLKN